jgi:hypothetical protein
MLLCLVSQGALPASDARCCSAVSWSDYAEDKVDPEAENGYYDAQHKNCNLPPVCHHKRYKEYH